jgi:hypothetical protein
MSGLLVGPEISMIGRVSGRPVVKGKERVEGLLELSDDVHEALFYNIKHLLIFMV